MFNIRAGRLRHQLRFYLNDNSINEWGEPIQSMSYIAQARGEVKVVSGKFSDEYGVPMTEQMITVLMWYNPNIRNDMTMDWVNDSGRYNIEHIRPSENKREMIVTAKLVSKAIHLEAPQTLPGTPPENYDPIVVTADGLHAFYVINHNFPVTPTVIFVNANGDEVEVDVDHLSPTSVQVSGNTNLVGVITVKSGL